MVNRVSYVTGPGGKPTAVQVQIEVWEQIVAVLQKAATADGATEGMTPEQDKAWDLFLSLAEDAQAGNSQNPSIEHDKYLYS